MKKQLEITTVNMKIYVRNNDVSKAYRILNKKLHTEGFFKEIRDYTNVRVCVYVWSHGCKSIFWVLAS